MAAGKKILKRDKYQKIRGGYSRLLKVCCEKCGEMVCHYQKDGPGILKRMYLDRMDRVPRGMNLTCSKCERLLGVHMIFKKENRPAFRLFVGAVTKEIVKANGSNRGN